MILHLRRFLRSRCSEVEYMLASVMRAKVYAAPTGSNNHTALFYEDYVFHSRFCCVGLWFIQFMTNIDAEEK